MDGSQLDALSRLLIDASSRRRFVRALGGGLAALIVLPLGAFDANAERKNTKKRKQKKPKPNAYGCLNVGKACGGDSSQCCSGICEGTKPKKGKKDTSRCVAHNTADVCFPDNDTCTIGANVPCNADSSCLCVLTTGNAGFCGDFSFSGPDSVCRVCSRDTDCQAEFGSGAACVVLKGICSAACAATGRTACIAACPDAEM